MTPIWKHLPASWAHALAGVGVEITSEIFGQEAVASWDPLTFQGITFPNRIGLAGGADKDGQHVLAWQRLGAGFVEIGTVTPRPQNPNPGKIMDRDWLRQNLWNKMGFPSAGASEVSCNLAKDLQDIQIPVLVNLGKNRDTSAEKAFEDYASVLNRFKSLAQGFVINVSSPNTVGLRGLQSADSLRPLCEGLKRLAGEKILLVKLSPDQSDGDFKASLESAAAAGVSGFVLTNTTLHRPEGCPFPTEGGLSGSDLKPLAEAKLTQAIEFLGPRRKNFLLVSVGGITAAEDVKTRLAMGADLVEAYSALVFRGPRFFQEVAQKSIRQDLVSSLH